jgi:type II secretory pathway predicted ATPase ExeA
MESESTVPVLLPLQQRAVARLAYAIERSGTLAVLCGPPGTGKSTVLHATARVARATGRSCELVSWCDAKTLSSDIWPDVILLDDVDTAEESDVARFVGTCRSVHPGTSVILAGCGRLLTLVARDRRLERSVRLRAVVGACGRGETRALVEGVLGAAVPAAVSSPEVIDAIHEIGGGIPSDIVRLAELAAIVAADDPGRPLTAEAVERIHARLAVTAA